MALRARNVSGAFEKLAHDCITEQGAAWGFSGWLTRKWVRFAIQTDTSSSPCSQCAVESHQGGGLACICIALHCTIPYEIRSKEKRLRPSSKHHSQRVTTFISYYSGIRGHPPFNRGNRNKDLKEKECCCLLLRCPKYGLNCNAIKTFAASNFTYASTGHNLER